VSTADDWDPLRLPELSGRRIVVVGATAGLGYFTAEELAGAGAQLVLAGRSAQRLEEAARCIREHVPGAEPELQQVDLADLASISAAADRMTGTRIDGLVANAGILPNAKAGTTKDGFDLGFGTNYLGHFALIAQLFPTLRQTPGVRIVTLGSVTHRGARLDPARLARPGGTRMAVYAASKLALMSFAFELDRRVRAAGIPVRAMSAHPGYAEDALTPARGAIVPRRNPAFAAATRMIGQGKDRGAWPVVRAVIEGEGGDYWGPSGRFELRGRPVPARATAAARDPGLGAALWEASERLTGVRFELG